MPAPSSWSLTTSTAFASPRLAPCCRSCRIRGSPRCLHTPLLAAEATRSGLRMARDATHPSKVYSSPAAGSPHDDLAALLPFTGPHRRGDAPCSQDPRSDSGTEVLVPARVVGLGSRDTVARHFLLTRCRPHCACDRLAPSAAYRSFLRPLSPAADLLELLARGGMQRSSWTEGCPPPGLALLRSRGLPSASLRFGWLRCARLLSPGDGLIGSDGVPSASGHRDPMPKHRRPHRCRWAGRPDRSQLVPRCRPCGRHR